MAAALWIIVTSTGTGFVLAGLVAVTFQVLSGRPLQFAMHRSERALWILPALAARLLGGPMVLLNGLINAPPAVRRENAPTLLALIALLWSFLTGIILLDILAGVGLTI